MPKWTAKLAIAAAASGLVSRLLFIVLADAKGGFGKTFGIHLWSFCLSGMLFVIWCSTPDSTNWFAAHKVFMPVVGWFIYDCLAMTGQRELPLEDPTAEEADIGR